MEFSISKQEFLRGLRVAQSIADRKSTMPLLANVLLRVHPSEGAAGGKLEFAATDLNVSVSAQLACTAVAKGAITVEAKALYDLVAAAPGDTIRLKQTDTTWVELKAGKATYRLAAMPERDYPKIAQPNDAQLYPISGAILRELIDRTLFSVCNDETRFHLNGALFEANGQQIRMVSTDGHRLSKVERELPGAPMLSSGVIIPKKGLTEIRKLADGASECKLAIKTPNVFVVADDLTLVVKLIEAQFPNYELVIPKQHKKLVLIDRVQLAEALKRTLLMASENRGVRFAFEPGILTVSSENPDRGEVREELDIEYDGEPIKIGFNPKYVTELLAHMGSEKVAIHLGTEVDPAVFRPNLDPSYLCLVMPMKI